MTVNSKVFPLTALSLSPVIVPAKMAKILGYYSLTVRYLSHLQTTPGANLAQTCGDVASDLAIIWKK